MNFQKHHLMSSAIADAISATAHYGSKFDERDFSTFDLYYGLTVIDKSR
jgi:hypothetical protein